MADVSERRVSAIVGEVSEGLKPWSQYAEDAGIEASWATKIGASFRKI